MVKRQLQKAKEHYIFINVVLDVCFMFPSFPGIPFLVEETRCLKLISTIYFSCHVYCFLCCCFSLSLYGLVWQDSWHKKPIHLCNQWSGIEILVPSVDHTATNWEDAIFLPLILLFILPQNFFFFIILIWQIDWYIETKTPLKHPLNFTFMCFT